ncbi:MAG: NAD(+) synthase [Prevotella sp.]|nr:NAD(+) synthase [Prevotella sp.]
MKYGFVTIASAIPEMRVANVEFNASKMLEQIREADDKGVEIIVFPELSLTGYTCQDLFYQQTLIDATEAAMVSILEKTRSLDIISIIGAPVHVGDLLMNCALVIQHGRILGIVSKTYLPNYGEFYEKRWFASTQDLNPKTLRYAGNTIDISADHMLFRTAAGVTFGVEICEDVWAPVPPSNHLALAGAEIIFNLSATDEVVGKHAYLLALLAQQSARMITGYVYSSSGFGESSSDLVYAGNALIYENGTLLAESKRFSLTPQLVISQVDVEKLRLERRKNTTFINAQRGEKAIIVDADKIGEREFTLLRDINPLPFIPNKDNMADTCEEIFNIQSHALARRLVHTSCKKVVIGISGGLDSTLALIACAHTFDVLEYPHSNIIAVTMPGFGTTGRTYNNAIELIKCYGATLMEINIAASVEQHFKDIGQDPDNHDATYENAQARERTQILMDLANKHSAIVVGTGDLSELALGWATYNGDHMSMYGLNAGIPKTLVKCLVAHEAEKTDSKLLRDILDTPISPELTPAANDGSIEQKTEDIVGPYDLHDFFIYNFLRFGFTPAKIKMLAISAFLGKYDASTIDKWLRVFLRRFFSQQFKRSCLPDGPKVGSVSLSPRGDWRMPSDATRFDLEED